MKRKNGNLLTTAALSGGGLYDGRTDGRTVIGVMGVAAYLQLLIGGWINVLLVSFCKLMHHIQEGLVSDRLRMVLVSGRLRMVLVRDPSAPIRR